MKQGFSSLDVKAIAHELSQEILTLRLSNVYELSTRILLFKFSKPDVKKQFIVDAGFRCHLTEFARTTANEPSGFIRQLRKLLKTRRVTSVRQVGTDRVIELQFSDGQYRMFLEFFAAGNIIVTDRDLRILALLRVVQEDQRQEQQAIGLLYGIEKRQNYGGVPPLTIERVKDALKAAIDRSTAGDRKNAMAKPGAALRKGLVTTITEIPPVLADHVLQANDFDVSVSPEDILMDEEKVDALFKALQDGRALVDKSADSERSKGYIIAKTRAGAVPNEHTTDHKGYKREDLLYEDYHPFLPHKFANNPDYVVLEYDSYNKTVDEFHSSIEGQKLESKVHDREEAARRKLNSARRDQEKRIEGLQDAQTLNLRKAAAIEANLEWVQEAMNAVNGLIDSGMDWVDVGKLIEREQKRKNPVAEMIKLPLKLAENTVTLLLGEEEEEEVDEGYTTDSSVSDSEGEDKETKRPQSEKLTVDIDLGASPWVNARSYHDQRRTAAEKAKKTALQSEKAMKSAEQKVKGDLKKGLKLEKPLMQRLRQHTWFDKFIWFVSSDGYLVLAGKDVVQNEMLYKRHLRKGDIYCHADVQGAACVVIKNNPADPDAPIPPSTLSQAGMLSICMSTAWDSKAVLAAWWVKADQVSKTVSKGEVLPPGSFTIRGDKNYLPPAPLVVGFGVLFRVSEKCAAKHSKHRIYDTSEEEPVNDLDLAGEESADGDESAPEDDDGDSEVDEGTREVQKDPESEAGENDDGDKADNNDDDDDDQPRTRGNPLQSDQNRDKDDDQEVSSSTGAMASLSIGEATPEAPEETRDGSVPTDDESQDAGDASESETDAASSRPRSTVPSEKKQGPSRRRRAKAKKIASKYKHQDEEDRAAIEELIGATAGRQRAEEAAREKARVEAEAEAQRERRRLQQERQRALAAEHEARRQKAMEEDGGEEPAGPPERLGIVETLVGTPLPGDEILEAVPVCAPWAALAKMKYRVKLQPGSMKRGKAVKEILDRWKMESERKGLMDVKSENVDRMWPREVELLRGLRSEEVVGVVPVAKVTIMMVRATGSAKGSSGSQGKKGGRRGKKK